VSDRGCRRSFGALSASTNGRSTAPARVRAQ
jgi:hypothetical protein